MQAVYTITNNPASKFMSAYNSFRYPYLFSLNKWPVLFPTSYTHHTPRAVYGLLSSLVCMFHITLAPFGPLIWNCVWLCPLWSTLVFLVITGLVRTLKQKIASTLRSFMDLRHGQWWQWMLNTELTWMYLLWGHEDSLFDGNSGLL